MITQDNRPETGSAERRLNLMKELNVLLKQPKNVPTDAPDEPAANDAGKQICININGDHNVVAAGKSQDIRQSKRRKSAFAAAVFAAFACLLFF